MLAVAIVATYFLKFLQKLLNCAKIPSMDAFPEIQVQLFKEIAGLIHPSRSVTDEVAGILGISTDSVYRRMNGHKSLSLDEFYLLCHTFQISADRLFNIPSRGISFDSYVLDEETFGFHSYQEAVLHDMEAFSKNSQPELIFMLNELNLLQLLQFPELAAFKFFFWAKSNMQFPSFQEMAFSSDLTEDFIGETSRKLVQLYNRLPSTELFTREILNSVLKQVNYYYISGFFTQKKDALAVCDSLLDMVEHLKEQAELGYKFERGSGPTDRSGNFTCYYNDLILTDNTILASSVEQKLTYITANAINLMRSDHPAYFEQNLQWARNIIQRSTLISGTAERERNMFFREIIAQIQRCILLLQG